jgi:hypothetical protein
MLSGSCLDCLGWIFRPYGVACITVMNALQRNDMSTDAVLANERVQPRLVSVAVKKGTSLAVETEPGVGLRSGQRWAQACRGTTAFLSQAGLSSVLTRGVR